MIFSAAGNCDDVIRGTGEENKRSVFKLLMMRNQLVTDNSRAKTLQRVFTRRLQKRKKSCKALHVLQI